MFLERIISIVVISLSAYLVYHSLNFMLFHKIKVNKWVVLCGALIILLIPKLAGVSLTKIPSYVQSVIILILLMWFFDIYKPNKQEINKKRSVVKPNKKKN